jgi:hypothetical protein
MVALVQAVQRFWYFITPGNKVEVFKCKITCGPILKKLLLLQFTVEDQQPRIDFFVALKLII